MGQSWLPIAWSVLQHSYCPFGDIGQQVSALLSRSTFPFVRSHMLAAFEDQITSRRAGFKEDSGLSFCFSGMERTF